MSTNKIDKRSSAQVNQNIDCTSDFAYEPERQTSGSAYSGVDMAFVKSIARQINFSLRNTHRAPLRALP